MMMVSQKENGESKGGVVYEFASAWVLRSFSKKGALRGYIYTYMCVYMVVSLNRETGDPNIDPKNTIVLIIEIPKTVSLILGNPHIWGLQEAHGGTIFRNAVMALPGVMGSGLAQTSHTCIFTQIQITESPR